MLSSCYVWIKSLLWDYLPILDQVKSRGADRRQKHKGLSNLQPCFNLLPPYFHPASTLLQPSFKLQTWIDPCSASFSLSAFSLQSWTQGFTRFSLITCLLLKSGVMKQFAISRVSLFEWEEEGLLDRGLCVGDGRPDSNHSSPRSYSSLGPSQILIFGSFIGKHSLKPVSSWNSSLQGAAGTPQVWAIEKCLKFSILQFSTSNHQMSNWAPDAGGVPKPN